MYQNHLGKAIHTSAHQLGLRLATKQFYTDHLFTLSPVKCLGFL